MREYSTLPSESDGASATKAFEVTASSTDASHAVVQPSGEMDRSNVHLLTSVLAGQLRLGRRFVRLDLSRTTVSDSTCLYELVPAHEYFLADRGLLALTNVGSKLAPLLRSSRLDGTLLITDGPGPGPRVPERSRLSRSAGM